VRTRGLRERKSEKEREKVRKRERERDKERKKFINQKSFFSTEKEKK